MQTTIRAAGMQDAAAIADIYNQAVVDSTATFDTQPQSTAEREAWLASHGTKYPVLVAEADGRVVAWAALSRWKDRPAWDGTAEVSVYVDRHAVGGGIGRALMTELIARARALRFHVLLSAICAENEVSIAMCDRFGFERVGVMHEVGEKFDRRLDVVIMELML